jgi:thioredoxin-like negative regulator of GroEL
MLLHSSVVGAGVPAGRPRRACRAAVLVTFVIGFVGCTGPTSEPAGPAAKAAPTTQADPAAAAGARKVATALADFNRGAALLEQYKYEPAATTFEGVVAAMPDWTAARFNLGLALLNQESREALERARKEFERVLATEPDNLWAHFCLGVYFQHAGENETALGHYRMVYEKDPSDPHVGYKVGEVLMHLNRNAEALPVLEKVALRDPGFVSATYRLIGLYQHPSVGKRDKAARWVERFKQLKGQELAGGSYAVGEPYGAKGRYYMAMAPDGLPVAPVDAAAATRVVFSPDVKALDVTTQAWKWSGGGVGVAGLAVGDLDGDGDQDVVVTGIGGDGTAVALTNDGKGAFKAGPKIADRCVGPCLGDVDNDGDLDLWIGRDGQDLLFLNDGKGVFTPAPNAPEKPGTHLSACARLVDLDSDGDLDLLSLRLARGSVPPAGTSEASASRVFLNKLDGTYSDVATAFGLAFDKTALSALVADDVDGDRDIDLVLLPAGGAPICWENYRVGQFKLRDAKESGLDVAGAVSATTGDPFKSGRRDLLVFSRKEVALFRNLGEWRFERDAEFSSAFGSLGGTGGQFFDADNDGDLDVLIPDAHRRDGSRGPALLINDWPKPSFTLATDRDPGNLLATLKTDGDAVGVAADFNGDGACDLLIAAAGQPLRLVENATKGGNWLAIDLVGKRDGEQKSRAPNSPIGARVEIRAGGVSQQFSVGASTGATAMAPLRIHAGLGDQKDVQWLRVLWPDSVLQAELELPAGKVATVSETNRRTTSCPHLFAWDGRRFAFVSDFGGVGGLGYRVGPASFAKPDPTEYVKLPHLEPRDGEYVLQVVEPLEEIVYFDEARLLAVDHPAGTEVFPNEMAAVGVDPPAFELFCFRGGVEPAHAVDQKGRDVTDALKRSDRVYATGPEPDRRYAGYAGEYFVELDFADKLEAIVPGARPVLLLDGWVEYSTSTSNFAAAQAGLRLKAPSVLVERGGTWVELAHEAGYPAGINHVMTLDLTGKLHPGDRKLRVATNMDITWDRIAVAVHRSDAEMAVKEQRASRADLHFLGFPREFSPDGRKPNLLDYANIDASTTWLHMPGAYTRYGDVTELVRGADDRFAIMASGDEITLRFPASAFGPLRPGYVRTFVLEADSYCKDMDLYTGGSSAVEPLPFHGMSTYPYTGIERYPDNQRTRAYRGRYNTRVIGR